jgi:hypothetical protein
MSKYIATIDIIGVNSCVFVPEPILKEFIYSGREVHGFLPTEVLNLTQIFSKLLSRLR